MLRSALHRLTSASRLPARQTAPRAGLAVGGLDGRTAPSAVALGVTPVGLRWFVRHLLAFYLTAPLLGCYSAVAVCLGRAWHGDDPFLAVAAVLVGAAGTTTFAGLVWAVRRLTA